MTVLDSHLLTSVYNWVSMRNILPKLLSVNEIHITEKILPPPQKKHFSWKHLLARICKDLLGRECRQNTHTRMCWDRLSSVNKSSYFPSPSAAALQQVGGCTHEWCFPLPRAGQAWCPERQVRPVPTWPGERH